MPPVGGTAAPIIEGHVALFDIYSSLGADSVPPFTYCREDFRTEREWYHALETVFL